MIKSDAVLEQLPEFFFVLKNVWDQTLGIPPTELPLRNFQDLR